MSKQKREHRYDLNQIKHFFAGQLPGRFVGVRVRQRLTYGATLFTVATLLFSTVLFAEVGNAWARPMLATAPILNTAVSFAVLAGSTATNTGPTSIAGDLGVSPGTAITGFPPGVVTGGTTHANDAVAIQAQNDVTTAYNNAAGQACDTDLTSQNLGGLTLTPGVYCFPNTSAQLTGALTLDGQGDANAVFIFQIGSTLTTASNASVLLINGASGCNVFWQVGSAATLGTDTAFVGNVLALASITLNTNTSLFGRALAQTGAVTMDTNNISTVCAMSPTPTNTSVPSTNTSTPTPTATDTSVPSTNTSTPTTTNTPELSTSTPTPIASDTSTPSTNTSTPAATNTPMLLTSTPTLIGPQAPTSTLTATPVPSSTVTPTSTLEPPTGLDPSGEPSASTLTFYLPLFMQ